MYFNRKNLFNIRAFSVLEKIIFNRRNMTFKPKNNICRKHKLRPKDLTCGGENVLDLGKRKLCTFKLYFGPYAFIPYVQFLRMSAGVPYVS